MEFPEQEDIALNQEEFMFGDDLLVAPRVWEFVGNYSITLPKGDWYDFWTGARVNAGKFDVNPPLETLPVYVRAGSVIPEEPVVQNVDEKPQGPLKLNVYPGPNCHGTLYADDGNTFAYQKGETLRLDFSCQAEGDHLTVDISSPKGPYHPWFDDVQLKIYGVSGAVKNVTADSRPISGWKVNAGTLTIPAIKWASAAHHFSVDLGAK